MHYAKIANSPRLQRTRDFLLKCQGSWQSTMEIIHGANVCAVNTIIDELRENGFVIPCRARHGCRGVYEYQIDLTPSQNNAA